MAGVSAVDPRVSFAELCQWPDDGRRYELYDGEVIVVPSPLPRHQLVAVRITGLLLEYAEASGGLALAAPLDIVLTAYDVVQPDVVFFRKERRGQIRMLETTRIPPDLAVEVLSRTTERRDRGRKMDLFARSGIPEYWIADPIGNVLEVYVLHDARYAPSGAFSDRDQVVSPTLTGLVFDARQLFEE
jgi:Uma2 family endonuclease